MTAVIDVRDAWRTYPGGVTAVRGASVHIAAGELVAVVGPSGSGKSTLLHVMGTLDRPNRGQVLIEGRDLATLRDRQVSALRARRIGFVFQRFHLPPGVRAVDVVADGLLYAGTPARQRRTRAEQTLAALGMVDRLGHRAHELSGGERQRVAIARATVGRPPVLLADEPTGNLDSRSGDDVLDLLRELNAAGTAVVVITHDAEVADRLPRRITLQDGQVVSDCRRSMRRPVACDDR